MSLKTSYDSTSPERSPAVLARGCMDCDVIECAGQMFDTELLPYSAFLVLYQRCKLSQHLTAWVALISSFSTALLRDPLKHVVISKYTERTGQNKPTKKRIETFAKQRMLPPLW